MMFEVGDTVAMRSTGEEGTVVRILADKMVVVKMKGVDFPIFENEIEHPYFNWFTKKKIVQSKTDKIYVDSVPKDKQANLNRGSKGMHFVFLPVYKNLAESDLIEKVKVILSNNHPIAYSFHYSYSSKSYDSFNLNSDVLPYSDFYIHDIYFEDLATNPLFEIACSQEAMHHVSEIKQFQSEFSIKPKKLMGLINEMHELNKPFFSHLLFNHGQEQASTLIVKPWQAPIKSIVEKPKPKKEPILEDKIILFPKKQLPKLTFDDVDQYMINPFEIDLHIEKLTTLSAEMDASEKKLFQLNIFQKALEKAIITEQSSLIVIHGVGKGSLKFQIHGILNQTKEVFNYVNEFDKRYGFGATEIFFKK